jgi:hypothetical protein
LALNFLEARVWLNNSEEAKKMEEEHIKSLKLIQDECKSKVLTLEVQVEELKEKISLGSANAASLSELLAESDNNAQKMESDYKKALAEIESQKKCNVELKKELSILNDSTFVRCRDAYCLFVFVFFCPSLARTVVNLIDSYVSQV